MMNIVDDILEALPYLDSLCLTVRTGYAVFDGRTAIDGRETTFPASVEITLLLDGSLDVVGFVSNAIDTEYRRFCASLPAPSAK